MIDVHDDVLTDPMAYRQAALAQPFQSVDVGHAVFRGIAPPADPAFTNWFTRAYPQYAPTLTFFRQSPEGQDEPNFIHTDVDMGDVTAILYLTVDPPETDGTAFWRHRDGDHVRGGVLVGDAGKQESEWECRETVQARFNRCVVFDAALFHSRAMRENYGHGDASRLIQVLFAKGAR